MMYINLTMTYQDVPFLTAPLTIDEAECEKDGPCGYCGSCYD